MNNKHAVSNNLFVDNDIKYFIVQGHRPANNFYGTIENCFAFYYTNRKTLPRVFLCVSLNINLRMYIFFILMHLHCSTREKQPKIKCKCKQTGSKSILIPASRRSGATNRVSDSQLAEFGYFVKKLCYAIVKSYADKLPWADTVVMLALLRFCSFEFGIIVLVMKFKPLRCCEIVYG